MIAKHGEESESIDWQTADQFWLIKRDLQAVDDQLMFPISFAWRFGCGVADRKLVQKAIEDAKIANILVTVESIDGAEESAAVLAKQSIAVSSFFESRTPLVLTIPQQAKPKLVGVYFCSDQTEQGNCGKKKAFQPPKAGAPVVRALAGNDVFYFGYGILQGRSLYVPRPGQGADELPRTGVFMSANLGWAIDSVKSSLKVIRSRQAELQPEALRVDQMAVRVTMPIMIDGCSSGGAGL